MNIEERRNYVLEMNEIEMDTFDYVTGKEVDNYGYYVRDGIYIVTLDEDMYDRAHDMMERFIGEIDTKLDWFDEEPTKEEWKMYHTVKDMLNDIYYDLR